MKTKSILAGLFVGWLVSLTAACGSNEEQAPAEATGQEAVSEVSTGPTAFEPTPMEMPAAQSAKSRDMIRGKGGLEEKCLKAVADQGTIVIGTNRIEESEAAIAIYVNVEGGTAPWLCLGYKDGTIGEVMFTGDEGAL